FLADPRPAQDFANWRRACQPRCVELIGGQFIARSLDPHSWGTSSDDDQIVRPWHELKSVPADRFVVERKKLAEKLQHRTDLARVRESKSTTFEVFDGPSSGGWRSSGTAFGDRPSRAGDFVL